MKNKKQDGRKIETSRSKTDKFSKRAKTQNVDEHSQLVFKVFFLSVLLFFFCWWLLEDNHMRFFRNLKIGWCSLNVEETDH